MEIRRKFFADSVSTTAVQLRRLPGAGGEPLPSSDPGSALHQVNITTGNDAAANADTAFWVANCTVYEVIIRRLT
jgi:hypothetical protein